MTAMAPNTLRIRPAVSDDLAAMVEIERASFSDPWSENSLASALSLDRMRVLVAEEPGEGAKNDVGRMAGYVVVFVVGDEAEIADLAVAPGSRRKGVGRALIEHLLAELGGWEVRALFLEVRESNRAARTLYEAKGFRSVGRRRGYYRKPVEDALVLAREIACT
jgi:ribosomal-protein-alanine N-acetyltransferase